MNQCKTDNIELLKIIKRLTEEEIRQRDMKAKEMNIKLGHFPYRKTINMFDFDFQPGIDRNKIMDLMTLRWHFKFLCGWGYPLNICVVPFSCM